MMAEEEVGSGEGGGPRLARRLGPLGDLRLVAALRLAGHRLRERREEESQASWALTGGRFGGTSNQASRGAGGEAVRKGRIGWSRKGARGGSARPRASEISLAETCAPESASGIARLPVPQPASQTVLPSMPPSIFSQLMTCERGGVGDPADDTVPNASRRIRDRQPGPATRPERQFCPSGGAGGLCSQAAAGVELAPCPLSGRGRRGCQAAPC